MSASTLVSYCACVYQPVRRATVRCITLGALTSCMFVIGCATMPPVAPTTPAVAAPMTLPRYLGVDTAVIGLRRIVYRSRMRVSGMLPMLEPQPAAAAPVALCDPSCLASPAPAVATAAAIQQAEATAPAKAKALAYLATLNSCSDPQVEEAFLAALNDPSATVRMAAIQAIIEMNSRCDSCANGCNGCCTPAIASKLQQLAFSTDERGCWCEPDSKVRRLARISTCRCGPTETNLVVMPEEVPAANVVELSRQPVQP